MTPAPRRWLAAVLLAAAAIAVTFDPRLYINGDNVDYMLMARAIRAGHLWPSDKYPPLFPLLLAPVQAVFGLRQLLPQKLLVLAFAFASVWLLLRIVRRRQGDRLGPWVLLTAATLIPVVEYSHYTMSEIPYLFFLLGAIDACDRLLEDRRAPPGEGTGARSRLLPHLRDRRIWALALWIAAAFYTRSAGVTVAAGVLVSLALASRRAEAAATLLALVPLGIPWFLHSLLASGGNPYFRQLLQVNPYYPEFGLLTPLHLWRRLRENGLYYLLHETPVTVLPAFYRSTYSADEIKSTYFPWWLSLLILVPLAIGIWRGVRRADPAVWCLTLTLVLNCLWPIIWAGSRFLVPVVPLLFLTWWSGWSAFAPGTGQTAGAPAAPSPRPVRSQGGTVGGGGSKEKRAAGKKPRAPGWRWLQPVVLGLLLLLAVRNLVFYSMETRRYPPEWDRYFTALRWVRERTPAQAVVIDRKPGFVDFVAERKGAGFPREKDPDRMLQAFRDAGATHVILSSLPYDDIGRYLQPVLDSRRQFFSVLFRLSDPATYVLQFRPEGGVEHGAPASPERTPAAGH